MVFILRRTSSQYVRVIALTICILVIVIWRYTSDLYRRYGDLYEIETIHSSGSVRSLLSALPNCTPRAIEQFPADGLTQEQRQSGAITVHIVLALYMFVGFALLCDDYFVPSLEVICDVLHIQSDVAGATFMAAGSSAPELATAIIAVFIAKDDIGIGTVVGSAVYNVMFVVSVCALFAGKVVSLNWWPLLRDCLFYSISVIALAIVIIDEKVYWYEAVIFILLYLLYICIMYYNSGLESWFRDQCCRQSRHLADIHIPLADTMNLSPYGNGKSFNGNSNGYSIADYTEKLEGTSELDSDDCEEIMINDKEPLMSEHNKITHTDDEDVESVLALPTECWKRIIWFGCLPLKLVFYFTIPDCRQRHWQGWFVVTFIMSLVWLSLLSYLMVWMITIIGYTVGIADTIMSLTLIAFGVSLPDVISSLIVMREGLGDMAVSNAVGSNVFDILICLGVPWFLQCVINQGQPVQVYSEGLLYATVTLLATVFILLLATHVNGWKITKKYGAVLMVVYIAFTILTCLYELNIFGYVHPAECLSNYSS